MIQKIKLTNFRRFKDFELGIDKKIVVLHGDNAKGKSTILESIYLVTNGVSPWASSDEYISNTQKEDDKYSRIEVMVDEKAYSFFKNSGKRVFKIDNHNTNPRKFFEKTASCIFNPEQIEILMISSSERRNFLDEAIVITQYDFSNTLKVYRKVLRQRNAYLKKLSKKFYENGTVARNDTQLNFWTDELLKVAKDIQEERELLCRSLSTDKLKIEYILSNKELALEDALESSKKRDIATGYTNVGPHRDDWRLINGSDVKKFGSRGEKRLAIGEMIFKKQEIIAQRLGFFPILLLDDIASELDIKNTKRIFNKEVLEKQQTFITIINYKDLPKEVLDIAQLVDLNLFE